MTRIRLRLVETEEIRCVDSRGESLVIPRMRLETLIQFAPFKGSSSAASPPVRAALIDTDTALSVFPEREWRPWEHCIEWLTFPAHSASHKLPRIRVLGGQYPYRMGRLQIAVVDEDGHRLPSMPVIAQFTEDAGSLSRILMGMRGGILEGRRLLVDVARGQAWLGEHGILSRTLLWMSSWLRGGRRLAVS